MRINEILIENSISKEVTINSIVTSIGSPITVLYDTLELAAKKFYDMADSDKVVKGREPWGFVKGNFTSRWKDKYWNNLQSHLRDLCKLYPGATAELQKFISVNNTNKNQFKEIEEVLPGILINVATQINNKTLLNTARQWESRIHKLLNIVNDFKQEHKQFVSDRDHKPKERNQTQVLAGQQRSQIEQVINDVLSKLPDSIRKELRPILDRSDNKLQTLKAELAKRNLIS